MATRCAWPPDSSRGQTLAQCAEPDTFERGGGAGLALGRRQVPDQTERDVVGDAEPGQQPRLLEHHADLGVRAGDDLAVEAHGAIGRPLEAGDQAQDRALAAAGAADQRDDLAGFDGEADAVERVSAVRISVAEVTSSSMA